MCLRLRLHLSEIFHENIFKILVYNKSRNFLSEIISPNRDVQVTRSSTKNPSKLLGAKYADISKSSYVHYLPFKTEYSGLILIKLRSLFLLQTKTERFDSIHLFFSS